VGNLWERARAKRNDGGISLVYALVRFPIDYVRPLSHSLVLVSDGDDLHGAFIRQAVLVR